MEETVCKTMQALEPVQQQFKEAKANMQTYMEQNALDKVTAKDGTVFEFKAAAKPGFTLKALKRYLKDYKHKEQVMALVEAGRKYDAGETTTKKKRYLTIKKPSA